MSVQYTDEVPAEDKLLKDVNNQDLAMAGLPDSYGSFLVAYIEDVLKLDFKDIKDTMTLNEFKTIFRTYGQLKVQSKMLSNAYINSDEFKDSLLNYRDITISHNNYESILSQYGQYIYLEYVNQGKARGTGKCLNLGIKTGKLQ